MVVVDDELLLDGVYTLVIERHDNVAQIIAVAGVDN